jgi:hypothetical protein
VSDYFARTPGPWLLKPRSEASAMGIKKIHHPDELWRTLEELGDRQSYFLLEKFVPGDVFHVDSVVWDGEVVFAAAHRYGLPPMAVYHGGGVFASSTVMHGSELEQALLAPTGRSSPRWGWHAASRTPSSSAPRPAGNSTFWRSRRASAAPASTAWWSTPAAPTRGWSGRGRGGGLARRAVHAAAAAPRLRRADRLSGAAGVARHRRLQRRRAGLAAAQAPSRRLHRGVTRYARVQALVSDYAARVAHDFSASAAAAPPLERPPR